MVTRVKICGITSMEDALMVAAAGADALGFVFYRKSPRYITPDNAAAIVRQLPPFVTVVGLFVDESGARVDSIRRQVGLDCLQFHGRESQNYISQFSCRVVKAVRVAERKSLDEVARFQVNAVLLDGFRAGEAGGTGTAFDWTWLGGFATSARLILAGGLTPDNVRDAIAICRPYGVDCSSGVEKSPRVKDPGLVRAFVRAVHDADREAAWRTHPKETSRA
ncbi:MAG TPA: phosphoribosylanthranilate isomerase [bacterium]|jgi:phosphoribosylanthranilate isomerase